MKAQKKFWLLFIIVCLLLVLGIVIKNNSDGESMEQTTWIFPIGETGRNESNSIIYSITPFSVSCELPQGWKIQERMSTDKDFPTLLSYSPLVSILNIYDENKNLVGAVGYTTYTSYEGDADALPIVYSSVRMGANYRFAMDDEFKVISKLPYGTVVVTDVIYQDGASADEKRNNGILAYDRTRLIFIGFEFDSTYTDKATVEAIAKSVRISD